MNITSYNITDVGYHYIGLRALAGLPNVRRDEQAVAISRSVLKYARDKALRLMLTEPRGSFETVGEKVCQELAHFDLARAVHGKGYELTQEGKRLVALLNDKRYQQVRRAMVRLHLLTYDNLRAVLQKHLEIGSLFSPIVEGTNVLDAGYAARLLKPTFQDDAPTEAEAVLEGLEVKTAKKLEDALRERVLRRVFESIRVSVPLFRSLCDRLVSLRLLNIVRTTADGCEFAKTYSPCVADNPGRPWYVRMDVFLLLGGTFTVYLSEPNMAEAEPQKLLLACLDEAFSHLSPQAGYYDLPDVRDFACDRLRIPEAVFDEGVNALLDQQPSPITVGLMYERISARRKPLVRNRESIQVFNLIRRS